MDSFVIRGHRCLLERLTERRLQKVVYSIERWSRQRKDTHVSVCRPGDIFGTGTVFHSENSLGNHLTGVRTLKGGISGTLSWFSVDSFTNDVHAKYTVSLFLDEELDLALGVQICLGARICGEGEFTGLVLHTRRLELLLRLADPRDFWVRVYD